MSQKAIITDLNRCVGCLGCTVACKVVNGVPVGQYWVRTLRVGPVPKVEGGQFPDVDMYFLPMQCQHCANPKCVEVCPTGASKKMEDGTVQIDKEACIGCQACVPACPWTCQWSKARSCDRAPSRQPRAATPASAARASRSCSSPARTTIV